VIPIQLTLEADYH